MKKYGKRATSQKNWATEPGTFREWHIVLQSVMGPRSPHSSSTSPNCSACCRMAKFREPSWLGSKGIATNPQICVSSWRAISGEELFCLVGVLDMTLPQKLQIRILAAEWTHVHKTHKHKKHFTILRCSPKLKQSQASWRWENSATTVNESNVLVMLLRMYSADSPREIFGCEYLIHHNTHKNIYNHTSAKNTSYPAEGSATSDCYSFIKCRGSLGFS